MSDNLTDLEKKFLTMLLKVGNDIIESQDGYLDFNYESFTRNDLFNLACKFGLENSY